MDSQFFLADRPFVYSPPAQVSPAIIYHDSDIVVVDKPAGLLSVPGKAVGHRDCLERRVQATFPDALTVHRLDMDTSGVMVMGRGKAAHRYLSIQFERRRPRKAYCARVWGHLAGNSGEVDLPLACDWPNRPLQKVDPEGGKPSLTIWRCLERETSPNRMKTSRVKLFPETGRSHQLRVHMLALGHPVLGDRFYAHDDAYGAASRLQLHAASLTIFHPQDDRELVFSVDCPFWQA